MKVTVNSLTVEDADLKEHAETEDLLKMLNFACFEDAGDGPCAPCDESDDEALVISKCQDPSCSDTKCKNQYAPLTSESEDDEPDDEEQMVQALHRIAHKVKHGPKKSQREKKQQDANAEGVCSIKINKG